MEKTQFFTVLYDKFIERGMEERYALKQIEQIKTNITPDDEKEILDIQSPDEINEIADGYYIIYKRRLENHIARKKAQKELELRNQNLSNIQASQTDIKTNNTSIQAQNLYEKENAPKNTGIVNLPTTDNKKSDVIAPEKLSPAATPEPSKALTEQKRNLPDNNPAHNQANEKDDDYSEDLYRYKPNGENSYTGKIVFWVTLILTLPITITLIAAVFGIFVTVFALISALIIGCVACLVVGVTGGCALSLIGIIYGITQTFDVPQIGAYEIGLGVMIAGCVMFSSILIYNFAIRLLPFVMKKVGVLFGICVKKLKQLFIYAKGECYKL